MLRSIIAVVVGYLVMALGVMAAFVAIPLTLGLDRVFKPGLYQTTDSFNLITLVVSFIAAVIGGLTCRGVQRRGRAPLALALVVLIFGIGGAVVNMNKPDPGPRTGEVALQDSGKLRQPLWYSWALPFAGAAGVMIGASLLRPRAAASPASTG